MAYVNHKFCWHGVLSTDVDAAQAFYSEALGWRVNKTSMGDTEATFFEINGTNRLHLAPPPMEGVPSHWNNYLRVEDVDAMAKKAIKNGGKQLVPATDIPPGRFSVVAAPSGAAFTLFKESGPDAQNAPNEVGGIHWTELHSTDIEPDLKWLTKTFGYTLEEMPMPTGPYFLLKDGDETAGGAMASVNPEAPSMWLTWVHVENVDETLTRVKSNGGKTHGDTMDVPGIGRMAICADPTGGVFGVITPPAE